MKLKSLLRADGWKNILTGLGIKGKDKRIGAEFDFITMKEPELEQLYAGDDMARKVVDMIPEDMCRKWWTVKTPDYDEDEIKKIMGFLDDFNVRKKFRLALSWARLYGGAGIVIGADDTDDPTQPLNLGAVKNIRYLTVLNRFELVYQTICRDVADKNFGMPDLYRLSPRMGAYETAELNNVRVHHTRVIRFDGVELPRREHIRNWYWGDSVLTALWNPLRNFNLANDGVATLLNDFSQGIYRLKNLADIIGSADGAEIMQKRLEIVDLTRSTINAMILDTEEEFTRNTIPLAGLPDTLRMVNQRFVTASSMPHTIILGESPSGLGATGDSEKSDYYDQISRLQEDRMKPQSMQLMKLVFAAQKGPTGGKEPPSWDVFFHPLWQMDQNEIADIRLKTAQTDKIYIELGVLAPEQVTDSRFGSGEFNMDTTVERPEDYIDDPVDGDQAKDLEAQGSGKPGDFPGASEGGESIGQVSLNGPQVGAIIDIVTKTAQKEIPRESAIAILCLAYPISPEQAEKVIGSAGNGFEPAPPPAKPSPFGGKIPDPGKELPVDGNPAPKNTPKGDE